MSESFLVLIQVQGGAYRRSVNFPHRELWTFRQTL